MLPKKSWDASTIDLSWKTVELTLSPHMTKHPVKYGSLVHDVVS